MSKVNFSLRKLSGEPNTTSSTREPVQLASGPGITPLMVVLLWLILVGFIPILRTVLIYQIKTTAAVHEDSGEMVSVDYWVEHQGSRSSVSDIGRAIPAIKSDRAGRPRVELGGDGLYGAYVSECMFAPSFCY